MGVVQFVRSFFRGRRGSQYQKQEEFDCAIDGLIEKQRREFQDALEKQIREPRGSPEKKRCSSVRSLSERALDTVQPQSDFRILIKYRDLRGRVSARIVQPRAIKPLGKNEALYAYCEMRRALRSFRLDRIEVLTDCDSGEIVEHDIGGWLHFQLKK